VNILRPVRITPDPAYPAWMAPSSRAGSSLRIVISRGALAALIMLGGCGGDGQAVLPDAGNGTESVGALSSVDTDDGSASDGAAVDGGRDSSPEAGGGSAESLMTGAAVGMPLALGLDPSEREPAAPRTPPPTVPVAPVGQVPLVEPPKPPTYKPPSVPNFPYRLGGLVEPVRMPGRRPPVRR
jgi:hypothetical protein